MFKRQIHNQLVAWKKRPDRKPLVLRGARQVGKTTAVEMFANEFDNYIYLNLELSRNRNIFRDDIEDVHELFQAILIIKNVVLKPGDTLIFIDEIQNSPAAVKILRFFYEELGDLFVVAAGSLLEIMLEKSDISFPVGRVEFLYMYPMSFSEYLLARKELPVLDSLNEIPVNPYTHQRLLGLFHEYALIGGMPEVVQLYLETGNVKALDRIYESLLVAYVSDAEKYARNDSMRSILRHVIESIPFESGKRVTFQGFGNSNYRSREVGEVLRTIEKAMLIQLIYPSTVTDIPIQDNRKKSPRLQFLDTGLLNYFVGLQPDLIKYGDLQAFYRGIVAEHIVRQELMTIDPETNRKYAFWVREKKQSNAEVDILLQFQNQVIPVEIKSGKTGTLKSLHQFMDRVQHNHAIRLYSGEVEITDAATTSGKSYRLLNLPYYLSGKLFEYLKWFFESNQH